MLAIRDSNQIWLELLQRLHHCSVGYNQAQFDWPDHQKGFSYKRIEEHKQEKINTKSEIVDEYEANMHMGYEF